MRRKPLAAASLIGLLGAAFVLHLAAGGDEAISGTAPCHESRQLVSLSVAVAGQIADGAYFSPCENGWRSISSSSTAVSLYSQAQGGRVVAWWYPYCGMTDGVVAVGVNQPKDCASPATTDTQAP
jgi:hypothetical protein